jgi:hypothetical protein
MDQAPYDAHQTALFRAAFDEGQGVSSALDFYWGADRLLDAAQRRQFFQTTMDAWMNYAGARATALADYMRATQTSWREMHRAEMTAWPAYDRAVTAARRDFVEIAAPAFAAALAKQEN